MGAGKQNDKKKKKVIKFYRPVFKTHEVQKKKNFRMGSFKYCPQFYVYPKSFLSQFFSLVLWDSKKNPPRNFLNICLLSLSRFMILNHLSKELSKLISFLASKKGCVCNFELIYCKIFIKKGIFLFNDSLFGTSPNLKKFGFDFTTERKASNQKNFFRVFYFLNFLYFNRDLRFKLKKNKWNFRSDFSLPQYRILFDIKKFKKRKLKSPFFPKKTYRLMGWNNDAIPVWLSKIRNLHREFKCDLCEGKYYRGIRAFYSHFSGTTHLNFLKKYKIREMQSKKLKGISTKKDILRFLKIYQIHVPFFF